jgi:hypothetical protein
MKSWGMVMEFTTLPLLYARRAFYVLVLIGIVGSGEIGLLCQDGHMQ